MTSAQVHDTALLIGDVRLGTGVEILPYTVIYGPAVIGDDTRIGPHAVIGTAPQYRAHLRDDTRGEVRIGARTVIREHVSVHRPAWTDATTIGNDVIVMAGAVINHDCRIDDGVVITSNVALAGTVFVMEGANLGQSCSVHQRTVIGAHTRIAMGATVLDDVPPCSTFIPGKPLKSNDAGVAAAATSPLGPDGIAARYELLRAETGRIR